MASPRGWWLDIGFIVISRKLCQENDDFDFPALKGIGLTNQGGMFLQTHVSNCASVKMIYTSMSKVLFILLSDCIRIAYRVVNFTTCVSIHLNERANLTEI